MRVTSKYLLGNFIPPFMVSCLFFVCFLLIFQLFRITKIVVQKGIEIEKILILVSHIAITFVPLAIPLACFFATIYTMNRMSDDSEIVVMRSVGLNKFQLFRPFLLIGVLIAFSVYGLNRNIIPRSKTIFKNTVIKLTSKGMFSDIRPETFFTDIPNVILFAKGVDEERSELKDVFINVADKKSKSTQSIFAEKGVLIKQRRSEWELPSIRMFLTNGNIITRDSEENEIQKILFKEYDFPISSNYRPSFITKDSMRSNQELIEHIHENQEKLLKMKPNNDDFKNTRKALVKSELEYYSRMNTPIQCVLFIFLGFIFGIRKSRGREKSSGPVSFLIIILYYSVFFAGMSFAKKGALPSQFVVFLPSVIAFIVASRFYKKIDWAS